MIRAVNANLSGFEGLFDVNDPLVRTAFPAEGYVLKVLVEGTVNDNIHVLNEFKVLYVFPEISGVKPYGFVREFFFESFEQVEYVITVGWKKRITAA